jgi:hypothetical protein
MKKAAWAAFFFGVRRKMGTFLFLSVYSSGPECRLVKRGMSPFPPIFQVVTGFRLSPE